MARSFGSGRPAGSFRPPTGSGAPVSWGGSGSGKIPGGLSLPSGIGGAPAGGIPTIKTATASAAGPVYTVVRLLGVGSSLFLLNGSNSNLSITASTGVIAANAAIPVGQSQTAIVSEQLGNSRIDYSVVITGVQASGGGTPTPTPTLSALLVSPSSGTVGTAYNGTISGRTASSSLALSGAGAAGLSINNSTGAISGTPTTAGAVNVVETLAGATNSPRTSNTALSVVAAGAATLMPLWKAQLDKAKTGQGQALVFAVGDSTTAGSQSGDTADGYNNNAYGNSPPIVANKLFQTDMGLPSIGNSLTGMGDSGMGSGSTLSYRPDLRNGQWGSTTAPDMSIGGAMAGGGSTTTLGFNDTGTQKFSRLDIMYPFATNLSTYNVSYPGASGVQISGTKTDSAAPDELRFSTFTYTASTSATSSSPAVSGLAKISGTTTNSRVIAIIARDMNASGVMVMNGGWSGATTASWRGASNPDGLSPIYGPPAALKRLIAELGVKLVSINLGINDARSDSFGVATATFTTRLGEIIDDVKASGADAMLIVPHWVATGSRPQSKQADLHQAIKDVANARGVPLMDITTIPGFETLEAATAAGYMHTDGIHLNKAGSSVVGTAYYNFIKTG